MYYTYILECSDGTYYCGYTNNVAERVKTHNEGKGAKYTKSRRPVKVIYYEEFKTKSEAMKREAEIKKMTRAMKKALIEGKTL